MAFNFSAVTDIWQTLFWPAVLLLSALYLAWGSLRTDTPRTERSIESPSMNEESGELRLEVPFDMGEVYVSKISVYPIKSCRGTSVPEITYDPEGIENDRKWCVMDAETHAILTARQVPKIVLTTPQLEPDASLPHGGQLIVSFPADSKCESFAVPIQPTPAMLKQWDIVEDAVINGRWHVDGYICRSLDAAQDAPSVILSKYFGRSVHLVTKGPTPRKCPPTWAFPDLPANAKLQDGYPVHVASEESLVAFQKVVTQWAKKGKAAAIGGLDHEHWSKGLVDMERFRPNIVFKGAGVPFAEDFWREIFIGPSSDSGHHTEGITPTIILVSKCARCLLPNVDTETGTRDAAVPYKILMKTRTGKDQLDLSKPCFGCNGIFGGYGKVRVGDLVSVKNWADADGV